VLTKAKNFLEKKGRIFLALVYLTAFGVGFLGGYLALKTSNVARKTTQPVEKVVITDTQLPTPREAFTVLLLGYGGEGHDGGSLSDVIMVAHVNLKEKKVGFISIPRDLWVEIPIRSDVSEYFKINHAFAIGLDDKNYPLKEPKYKGEEGAAALVKEVVKEVIGIPIDYFIAVDFENFKNIIDTLGGVDVEVPVSFDDYFYPIKGLENETCGFSAEEIAEFHSKYSGFELEKQFFCRYEHIHFDKGKNHMDGAIALKYVRSRHSNEYGGDFARLKRQQSLLVALRDKLISLDAVKNIEKLFGQMRGLVKTDLDIKEIKGLIKGNEEIKDYKVSFISLTDENVLVSGRSTGGQFILIPKEGQGKYRKVQEYIKVELAK